MFNEFQQEIIAAVAIVCILTVYFILKRSSIPKTDTEESVQKNVAKEVTKEEIEVVPEVKEEPKMETLPELVLNGKEEGDFGVVTSSDEDTVEDSASRRKSDKTIHKRAVPEHAKITKQNFSEFAGERILVAEDNLINQKVLMGLLAGSGIDLVMANDGQEALDILEKDSNFVMVLMVAHMPRVDGFEATRAIRANPKYDHILVVALSGDTAADDIQKMKNAGMSEQLEKPLRMESLYNIIYAYTGKETNKEEFIEVIMTKDLNGDKGLQTCGGDEDFYREILSEFISDYSNSSDKLGELLRSNDMNGADQLLLDVIGVTANIGARPLNEIASNMKIALSDTHEQSYFSLLDQYKIHLDRLIKDIKEYL